MQLEALYMKFQYSGRVERTPDEVFGVIADIERKHEWVSEVVESRVTSPGPVGEATTYVDVVRFMGRTSEIPTVITRYEPGRRLAYRHTDGPIRGDLDYELLPEADETRISVTIDAELPLYLRVLGPLLTKRMGAQMDGNFASLRRLLSAADEERAKS